MTYIYAAWFANDNHRDSAGHQHLVDPKVKLLGGLYSPFALKRHQGLIVQNSKDFSEITRSAQVALENGVTRILLSQNEPTPFDLEILK